MCLENALHGREPQSQASSNCEPELALKEFLGSDEIHRSLIRNYH